MKRSKNDHIRSTISRYFKRRQFHESEMPSRKDGRREQTVTELSVRRRAKSRTSVENTLALTSISGDATACDQQFTRFKHFILGAASPHHPKLQPLLLPMFVHTYLEMLCNGQKVPAQKFHERHGEMFTDEKSQSLTKLLKKLETKAEVMSNKEVTEYREHRFLLSVEPDTMDYLMHFLKTDDSMIMLQVFNQCVKVNVTKSESSGQLELQPFSDMDTETTSVGDTPTDVTVKTEASQGEQPQQEQSLEEELSAAISAVRGLPPCLPSICFFTFLNTYQGLCSSTISPDKKKLSGCFEDASISIWNLEPDVFRRAPADTDVSRIVLGADHILFSEDEIKERMNKRSGQSTETAKLVGHRGPVYRSRFLYNSNSHLLSCSEDSSVRLWDMATQSNVCLYKGHSSAVWDVSVSSTDTWFASSSHDTTAKLWTTERTFPLRSYVGHTMDVDCVEFHPNNSYLASGSGDKTVRFWSLTEARSVRLLQGHRGSVLALAFSPDGKLLASAGEDRRLRVWDLRTGRVMKELRGHSDTVYALAFDENSSVLASGGADCCVRLWDVNKATDTPQAEGHSSPELLGAFPTKSALISYLSFSSYNVLLVAGASS
ncbi:TAF5-like RNA polymerase II p300/CBP-associated factor-associated factor 65 kDa subunit 5L [Aplysia californica]|uniref:TAF5-like RNA polymerase II p300/CBP-associated factor-associated factor 65 kDa subunit 5L n=1 Tax=Aplysia californica TaxID=6500 RepID=A0ABM0K631_APLCA|nr:TAF5-like RNA polymerase II p300/CBP-associated factor-associated factor 65 kDa subunit 5L [Aplysia californica]